MKTRLRVVVLALLAVIAVSAVAAQTASATNHEFEAASLVLTGEDIESSHLLGIGAQIVCEVTELIGTMGEKTADDLKVTPSMGGHCTIGGTAVGEVSNNGCAYTLDTDTTENHARLSVVCGHTGSITITDPGSACVIHISDTHTNGETVNQNLAGIAYENAGTSPNDLVMNTTIQGLAHEATGFGCFLLGIASTGTNGIYVGKTTLRAYEDVSTESVPYTHNAVQIGLRLEEGTTN